MNLSEANNRWVRVDTLEEATEARSLLGFSCNDSDLKDRLKGFRVENTPVHLNHNHICTLSANMEGKEDVLTWAEFKALTIDSVALSYEI